MGFGKDNKGAMIREGQRGAVGEVLSAKVKKFASLVVLEEDFRILKSNIVCYIEDADAGDGAGLMFGICNGELTETEIEECLEATGPVDRNDRLAQEKAERNVKILGAVLDPVGAQIVFSGVEGGPLIESKHRWTYSNPEGWAWFIYNNSNTSIAIGANFVLEATHFGVWVT